MLLPVGGAEQPVTLAVVTIGIGIGAAAGAAAADGGGGAAQLSRAAVDESLACLATLASVDTHFRVVHDDAEEGGPKEVATAVASWSRLVHALRPADRGEPATVSLLLRSSSADPSSSGSSL
jgi:hypothetical protein